MSVPGNQRNARAEILDLLKRAKGGLTYEAIEARTGFSRQTILKAMRALKNAGDVTPADTHGRGNESTFRATER